MSGYYGVTMSGYDRLKIIPLNGLTLTIAVADICGLLRIQWSFYYRNY
jgi:hypothetical protein